MMLSHDEGPFCRSFRSAVCQCQFAEHEYPRNAYVHDIVICAYYIPHAEARPTD